MSGNSTSSPGFERRSETTLFGLPLVHSVGGKDPFTGKRRVACGVVAIGQFAIGGVALCQAGAGLVVVSQFAAGLLFGVGQFIVAPAAIAQFAATVLGSLGQFAVGFATIGQFAVSPGNTAIGQSTVDLGEGPIGLALTCLPAVLAWLIAAKVLNGFGGSDPRARHARQLPGVPACNTAGLRQGDVVLRARVASAQGTIFDAAGFVPGPGDTPRLRVTEFEVEDEHGKAVVHARDAVLFVAGRDQRVSLGEGDVVEIEGTAHLTPHPDGARSDYRQPPARWTLEARTLAGNQSIQTVRAMARFPAMLGRLMAAAAAATVALVVTFAAMH